MLTAATIIVALSILIGMARLLFAKSDADRVISVDVLGFQLIGMSILLAFHDLQPLGLQLAFALSLLSFLSILILSRLIRSA